MYGFSSNDYIDSFKLINDTYGHIVGDGVIRALSQAINIEIRYTDIAGRFGGEEFLLTMVDSNKEDKHDVIKRIAKRFSELSMKIVDKKVRFRTRIFEIDHHIKDVAMTS